MVTSEDYKLGEYSFPRGWFAMATTAELGNTPLAVRAMGKEFVLYRTDKGAPVMLDAYCPHMGSHLASGQMSVALARSPSIVGDQITCPLHGWRFGADGKCKAIPYSNVAIPRGLGVKSYTARDYAGFVIAWHDPEHGEPDFEPAALPEWDDPRWIRGPIKSHGELPVHQAEMIDHHVDKVHIITVHGQDHVANWVTHIDGIHVSQRSTHRQLVGKPPVTIESNYISDYRGPGFMIMRIHGPQPMIVYSAGTPVENGTTRFWNSTILQSSGVAPGPEDFERLTMIGNAMEHAFIEDHDILERKLPSINPKLIPGDGAFRAIRTWYRQFYHPRAQAADFHNRVNGDHATEGDVPVPWAAVA